MEEKNTMYDYLKWRGDLTFDQDPFNEVDNLILAQMAYVDYEEIVPETREGAKLITDVSRRYWEIHTEEEIRKRESFVKLSPFLLKPVAGSRRFSKTRLCGYVNFVSKNTEAQMSATQFELEDGSIYVAFRGTDETIVGWKEDFNLSFMSRTEGQKLAVEYMKEHFGDTSERLRVGGHSKGGNFAVFASAFSGQAVRDQIVQVFTNDAPGFREEIVSTPEYEKVMAMTINIIPQDSIIGRLLNAGRDAIVVRSSKKGIMQHDALTWEIEGNHFIPAKRSSDSIYLEKVLSGWLENVDDDSRKIFVEQIFGVMQTLGADTMKDVRQITIKELGEAIQMMRSLPRENQAEMADVLKKLVASGSRVFNEEMEHKEGILPDVFKKLSDVKERLNEARQAAEAARIGVKAAVANRQEAALAAAQEQEAAVQEQEEVPAAGQEEAPDDERPGSNTDHVALAKSYLGTGINIEGGEPDDNDGEDPQ